ncbi:unnamed protein product, partial [Laminaria digitata]
LGPSGLLGWTNTPGLALAQIVTSVLGGIHVLGLGLGLGWSLS